MVDGWSGRGPGRMCERGQVAPLVALCAVAVGVACLGLGRFAGAAVDAASARTAADAAALAGAASGGGADAEAIARGVAAANGGSVSSYEAAGRDVRVGVRVGSSWASARARSAGGGAGADAGGRVGGTSGLAPALRAALARAGQLLGEPVPVTSGFRSASDQRRLWLGRATNRYPVAPPGTSMHERGLAVDVPASFAERLAPAGRRVGLCRPYPRTDPVHFEWCRAPSER